MSFDLSELNGGVQKLEDGIPVHIKHPSTDKKTGIVITVASYESERVKKVAREMGNKAMLKQRRNPNSGDTVEAVEERTFSIAVAAIVGWEGIELDGKPLKFTRDNARMILEKYSFIAEQIDAAAEDRALFFTG